MPDQRVSARRPLLLRSLRATRTRFCPEEYERHALHRVWGSGPMQNRVITETRAHFSDSCRRSIAMEEGYPIGRSHAPVQPRPINHSLSLPLMALFYVRKREIRRRTSIGHVGSRPAKNNPYTAKDSKTLLAGIVRALKFLISRHDRQFLFTTVSIIDVAGGESTLADDLHRLGYTNNTVLGISPDCYGLYHLGPTYRLDSGILAAEGLAGNVRVPVDERAVGILLPRPDMQCVERREPEAVGAFKQMKELSHKLWRARILCVPRVGENQIVGADQSQASVWCRLIDHDLGTGGVNYPAVHQVSVHKVESHGPAVGPADAAELKGIPLRLSHRDILESLGRLLNNSDKRACIHLLICCQFLIFCCQYGRVALRQGAREADTDKSESNDRILELRCESSDFHCKSLLGNMNCCETGVSGPPFRFLGIH